MSVARGCTTLTDVDVRMLDYWMLDKKVYPNKWGKFRGILINWALTSRLGVASSLWLLAMTIKLDN